MSAIRTMIPKIPYSMARFLSLLAGARNGALALADGRTTRCEGPCSAPELRASRGRERPLRLRKIAHCRLAQPPGAGDLRRSFRFFPLIRSVNHAAERDASDMGRARAA